MLEDFSPSTRGRGAASPRLDTEPAHRGVRPGPACAGVIITPWHAPLRRSPGPFAAGDACATGVGPIIDH
ncbi:MAG: hypothetical protein KGL18_11460 [Burkholderiales bacterium]|nr:hypothetical protein [Burkholderiales bacterium]